ncbi:MAG: glycosyltransferase family 4 protein [Ignavibacteriaceae bacterium]|nr:glycosyltransferase family 4 protein [Ignavibacteriaceae bacterium]
MAKTKILYVITSLGLGGAENLLLSYLKKLDHNKYKFYVCSLRKKPDDLLIEISRYAEVTNLQISNRFNPNVIFYLLKLLRQVKPDIIHTHLFQARFYTTIAHLFYKHSILITHKHNNVNPRKHNVFIILEMLSIFFNKKVIAISQSVKNSLIKYEFVSEKKIYVLPNGIEYQKFLKSANSSSLSNNKPIIIGTVCRLERQKGISYLLLAMKIILAKFPHVQLEIVGDGSLLGELKHFSRKLGISNSVNFFGKFADVIPFYKKMNVFVLPSLYEGFGIVLLEAMAAGVPIVATNVDGIKEVVMDGVSGILVPPKNPEAIASAVTKIIESPHLARSLVDEGLKRSKLFDIQEHVTKIDNFYTNLLGVESYK